jgi:TolA-binding protein
MLSLRRFSILFSLLTLVSAGLTFAGIAQDTDSLNWILEDAVDDAVMPLSIDRMVVPADLREAALCYQQSDFRGAAAIISRYLALRIPDGNTDFFSFMLAECYRALRMPSQAVPLYQFVANRYRQSDKTPLAIFRLIEYAADDRDLPEAERLFNDFQKRFFDHAIRNSVLYTMGKLCFQINRYEDAIALLDTIPAGTSRHFQAQFTSALCKIQVKKYDNALTQLGYIRLHCPEFSIINEAAILIGDIYGLQRHYGAALNYYRMVSPRAARFHYGVVKTVCALADSGRQRDALALAWKFTRRYKFSPYLFDMAAIMDKIYRRQGDLRMAGRVGRIVGAQLQASHMRFEINDELRRVIEIRRRCFLQQATRPDNQIAALIAHCDKLIATLQALIPVSDNETRNQAVAANMNNLDEQRYLDLLRGTVKSLDDTIAGLAMPNRLSPAPEKPGAAGIGQTDSLRQIAQRADSLRALRNRIDAEFRDLRRARASQEDVAELLGVVQQVKFIDWAIESYQESKLELAIQKSKRTRGDTTRVADSLTAGKNAAIDLTAKAADIEKVRRELIDYIEKIQTNIPANRYSARLLLRCADLYNDAADDDFARRLADYEAKLAAGVDSTALVFPIYALDTVLATYDRIITEYPDDPFAPDALFAMALAMQKEGRSEDANDLFIDLVKRYPESVYYVEANMNVGRYFFDHPKSENGKGYQQALEAYMRVLAFKDHPQYVEALYRLGWCYYMQDNFNDAIEVFRFMVQETHLDFETRSKDEKQMVNPLLRDEAIDYIAISFDEGGKTDEAVRFLTLIGNQDYTALVLNRIAELREEDLDYPQALAIYQRILKEYPNSSVAPDAAIHCIKIMESGKQHEKAMAARTDFISRFDKAGPWRTRIFAKDSARALVVDSMVVAIGLSLADEQYQNAESRADSDLFRTVIDGYSRITAMYPTNPYAAQASWNLALMLQNKTGQFERAMKEFMSYSRFVQNDSTRREQAALNAVAIAQKVQLPDSATVLRTVDSAAGLLIAAASNYTTLFPRGKSAADVLMIQGALFFTRKMFDQAQKVYAQIGQSGDSTAAIKAQFLIAQCNFSQENWQKAADLFENVWANCPDSITREKSYALLIQSRFLSAKQIAAAGDLQKAATLFEETETRFPGAEYGDVLLFNAAETWEKLQNLKDACRVYALLAKKYPQSKMVPDALFNAASDYEKAGKFEKSAANYESIISQFPDSPRAKDALFNIAFSYEKLEKPDLMAAANERYAQKYPEEKDAELTLLRSAAYYFKVGLYDKAIGAYTNFINRYTHSPQAVQALWMVGKCAYAKQDMTAAIGNLQRAEELHASLGENGNAFYAAEAAYLSAQIKQDAFTRVMFDDTAKIKENQKWKTELLTEAARAYQRVIQYQSERMFEAAYRIGALYEEYARAWSLQKRTERDAIKTALVEKDIKLGAAALLQKCFEPHVKVIEFTNTVDPAKPEQRQWSDSARTALGRVGLLGGKYMVDAIEAMERAPLPQEIEANLLYEAQYRKQLIETIEPMKIKARDYFDNVHTILVDNKVPGDAEGLVVEELCWLTFLLPNGFDLLAEKILVRTDELPQTSDPAEREDLIFQCEDIIYDLQDKAVAGYEDALGRARKSGCNEGIWVRKIMERLARLRPEEYGKNIYPLLTVTTDTTWGVRSDSVPNWNTLTTPADGWRNAEAFPLRETAGFPDSIAPPTVIWSSKNENRLFFVKNIFLDGTPRDVRVKFALMGRFAFYVNGVRVSIDTSGRHILMECDSLKGLASLFKGGDNVLGLDVVSATPSLSGVAVMVTAQVDTSAHFRPRTNLPAILSAIQPEPTIPVGLPQESAKPAVDSTRQLPAPVAPAVQYTRKADVIKAIQSFRQRELAAQSEIQRERLAIQKLQVRDEWLTKQAELMKKRAPAGKIP